MGIANSIKKRIIKYTTKVYDPLVDIAIGNQTIKIPLSHQLREIVKLYPEYNYNLPRIVKYLEDKINDLKVIDIGANVGDTVAFIRNFSEVPILCIDGEDNFLSILKQNIAQYRNVSVCKALVGAENKTENIKLVSGKGTAFIEKSSQPVTVRTLENILEEFSDFKNSKILKSDTDGFDTIILRASADFLKRVQPILFFEFDPYLISRNNDDPFAFIDFLKQCGYSYLIFYVNNGDYLLSTSIDDPAVSQLIHYFSGRNINMFADVCAFSNEDKPFFDLVTTKEVTHFKTARRY